MRVGDFARLGNVSSRTLRFYCQVGLLVPAHVDSGNGYRHYEPRQLAQLHHIQEFKEMGLSLSEIRELLKRQLTAGELRELFRERRASLLDKIKQDSRRLAQLDAHLRALETNRSAALQSVYLRQTQPVWVVSLREKIHRYDEAEQMFEEVERRVDPANLSGQRAALWHTCANEGPTIDCEVLRFLKRPIPGPRALRTFQLPGTTVASIFHLGGDRTLDHAYRVLSAWLATSRYLLAGPKREIYWQEARPGNELESLTEIQFPVVQARRAKRAVQIRAA
jgi:DNA-binding transcriptional MerR regulator